MGRAGWPNSASARRNSSENGAKRATSPPMIASIRENPYWAVRMTDWGLPPTPIQVGSEPVSLCG